MQRALGASLLRVSLDLHIEAAVGSAPVSPLSACVGGRTACRGLPRSAEVKVTHACVEAETCARCCQRRCRRAPMLGRGRRRVSVQSTGASCFPAPALVPLRRRRPLLIFLCSALSTCASSASSLALARVCLASPSAAPKMGAFAIAQLLPARATSNKARNVAWRLQNTLESIRILSVCDDIMMEKKLGGAKKVFCSCGSISRA